MSATFQSSDRKVHRQFPEDQRWDAEFADKETRVEAVESRKGPGISDLDEWKSIEWDQVSSGHSIFDLDASLDESDCEIGEPSGKL